MWSLRRFARHHFLTRLSLALFLSASGAGQAQSGPTMIQLILDSSGSMFSRLPGGDTRMATAQAVMTDFIGRLPNDPNLNVGLRLYGAAINAADPGACQDSKLVLPMRGLDRSALLAAVRGARPKGATPIVYSLQQAAQDFPTTAGRRIVVLVTDGQESCQGDVKGALEAFRSRGLEVDVRVIGIDLDARAQASFAGVGTFVNTRSAGELASALGQAVQAVAPPAQVKVPVVVTLTSGGQPVTSGPVVRMTRTVGGAAAESLQTVGGEYRAELTPGTYSVQVEATNGTQTYAGLTVTTDGPNRFSFNIAAVQAVQLQVAPAQPVAGGRVTVTYSGAPGGTNNWVTLARREDPDTAYLDWSKVSGAAGQVDLAVQDEETVFEARYMLVNSDGSTRVVGRSAPFTARRASVSLAGPGSAAAGSQIEVRWTGPNNPGDYVTIVPKGAPVGTYLNYFYTRNGNPGRLITPLTPGDYEIRYNNDISGRMLASVPITLSAASYGLQAPTTAVAGSQIEVRWTGPNNPGDYVTIVPKGAPVGSYLNYFYTRNGNPGRLITPLAPGDYEVRYSTEAQSPNPTLHSVPVRLSAATYGLVAPREAKAGSTIQVRWTGPNNGGDYVTIVRKGAPVGAYLNYFYTSAGNPGQLTLPSEPGEYELRYSTEAQSPNPTLFSVPFTVR
ncbi:VWA domain-containing protein [Deinococcus deserti]|uniref:Putative Von Willebrand factor type A domain protein n=1 Tax=Deinococcus deserti (strain DSM 17065 / CIP 109153 / LMG 22923 / VCD115) TaxID=546414 RepID=C1D3F6_DEIDV|nr:VWA domain-containing protein [Deinococcus deserti]ACO48035.2 putative Von Willebrand factor type A domain protein, precursor [Deinococcus deserti VCD115]